MQLDLHLGLAQDVPGILPRTVHGHDARVRVGHGRQLSQIAQIPRMEHQLQTHAGLSVSIPAADVVVVAVGLSGTIPGRRAAPIARSAVSVVVAGAAPGRAGGAVAPGAGVRAVGILGVVRAGPTKATAGHGHRRFLMHGIMVKPRIVCISRVRRVSCRCNDSILVVVESSSLSSVE